MTILQGTRAKHADGSLKAASAIPQSVRERVLGRSFSETQIDAAAEGEIDLLINTGWREDVPALSSARDVRLAEQQQQHEEEYQASLAQQNKTATAAAVAAASSGDALRMVATRHLCGTDFHSTLHLHSDDEEEEGEGEGKQVASRSPATDHQLVHAAAAAVQREKELVEGPLRVIVTTHNHGPHSQAWNTHGLSHAIGQPFGLEERLRYSRGVASLSQDRVNFASRGANRSLSGMRLDS